jgi:hypothetical protein
MIKMKNLAGMLWLLIGITRLQAQQTASFNFSLGAQPVSGWTNISGDPALGVRTGTAPSGITVSSISTSNWAPFTSGACASDGGGETTGTTWFFPAAVILNHWFQYSDFLANYNALMPQLQIGGLSRDSVYTIQMTGSYSAAIGFFSLNPVRYTVAGTSVYGYVDVDCEYNTANGATFHNIAPDSNGHIRVYVNTYGGSNVASICGLQITSGRTSSGPVVTITHPLNNSIIAEDANVTISATATETGVPIKKVEFFVDSGKIGEVTTPPYNITWSTQDPGTYMFKVSAVDSAGNINTATSTIQVESLNYFWSTTGNIATGGDTSFIGTVDTNRLAIRTNNIERVSILGDGTVGIGTKNTQGYQLAVNGSAIFTKVRIRSYSTWPDYVFKRDYKLPGIDELEKYIALHRHLPGVVPAGQAEKEGLDIADAQAALLKKIEELTLYMIAEHKRVEKLAGEVKRLRTQNLQLKKQKAGGK